MNKDFDNMDELARDAFQNFEVDFNPEDWKLMEAKLDKKEHHLPRIWLFKGIEALVLTLLIFTSINLWYSQSDGTLASSTEESGETENTFNLPELSTEFTNAGTLSENSIQEQLSTANDKPLDETSDVVLGSSDSEIINTTNSTNTNLPKNYTTTSQNQAFNTGGNATDKKANKTNSNVEKTGLKNSSNNNNKGTTTTELERVETPLATQVDRFENASETKINPEKTNLTHQEALQNEFSKNSALLIEPIDITKTKIIDNNGGGGKDEGTVVKIENNFKFPKIYYRQLRIGIYSGGEMNLPNAMGTARLGMAFGVMIENEISDRFAIRSGLVISRKNYENDYVSFIDRSATEGMVYRSEIFKKTTLGTIQLPVALNYIAFRDNKWKFSLNIGVAAQLLTHRHIFGTQRTTLYQDAGGMVSVAEINPNTQEKGVWQGGATGENTYFVGLAGFELERRLGDRISLFLQPVYQHDFTPIGKSKDYIHTVSVNVGLKTILK